MSNTAAQCSTHAPWTCHIAICCIARLIESTLELSMSSDNMLRAILRRSLPGDRGANADVSCRAACLHAVEDDLAATYGYWVGLYCHRQFPLVKSHSCARRRSTGFHPRGLPWYKQSVYGPAPTARVRTAQDSPSTTLAVCVHLSPYLGKMYTLTESDPHCSFISGMVIRQQRPWHTSMSFSDVV
jgi:hypothetical protein